MYDRIIHDVPKDTFKFMPIIVCTLSSRQCAKAVQRCLDLLLYQDANKLFQ